MKPKAPRVLITNEPELAADLAKFLHARGWMTDNLTVRSGMDDDLGTWITIDFQGTGFGRGKA